MVYGTAVGAAVVFARNDGNLTRMEALLGIARSRDADVLVSGVEIPWESPRT